MTARRRLTAVVVAIAASVVLPLAALAHPLGNFTVNHYAGIHVRPDLIQLDLVIDEAEIPSVASIRALDRDGDGALDSGERQAGAIVRCDALAAVVDLRVDGDEMDHERIAASLRLVPGQGGLPTLRLECRLDVRPGDSIRTDRATRLTFAEGWMPDRAGWREIVATGDGVRLTAIDGVLRDASPSQRLASYPDDPGVLPLADETLTLDLLADPTVPSLPPVGAPAGVGGVAPGGVAPGGVAPGGVAPGEVLPDIFARADASPLVAIVALFTAALLGAGHALTPGHGKTLMAAYLVGTRGAARHAVGLGLSVSLSHTIGILALALLVTGAVDVLPPDVVVRIAPLIAALSIVAIGTWMVLAEVGRRRARATHEHLHEHDQHHEHENDHAVAHADGHADPHAHRHGPITHSHAPVPGSRVTWRSLFALGLAGGLIPSTSALLILLGSIAAGRPVFGLVLVLAFGLGMAAVMTAIGLATVVARERLESIRVGGAGTRLMEAVPAAAAAVVVGFGIWLTIQAAVGVGAA